MAESASPQYSNHALSPAPCAGIRRFLESRPGCKRPQAPSLTSLHDDARMLKVQSSAAGLFICAWHECWGLRSSSHYAVCHLMHPLLLPPHASLQVIRAIISKTENFSSADVFAGLQQLSQLRAQVRRRCRHAGWHLSARVGLDALCRTQRGH